MYPRVIMAAALALALDAGGASGQTTAMVPRYAHILIVVEENQNFDRIIGSSSVPFLNQLASAGALLTNDHALIRGSPPNYFAMYAGSTFGAIEGNPRPPRDPSLYTVLRHAGLSFTGYVDPGAVDPQHNPWESFPEGTSVEKNFIKGFPHKNLANLPSVSFVIPNLNHDMHDGSAAEGDFWLEKNLGAFAQWAPANDSLLIVTFDENGGAPGDRVATILYGAKIAPGTRDGNYYTHYNLLSTVLGGFNLTGPRHAATAAHYAVFQP